MALQSMTGFARAEGTSGRYRWAWELRSVNGKGLDIRMRLPQGMEGFEAEVRRLLGQYLTRGNVQVGLNVSVSENRVEAVLNRDALDAVLRLRDELGTALVDPTPLRLDALLAIRGLVDFRETQDDEAALAARDADILAGLEQAARALCDMRKTEGDALCRVLSDHVSNIQDLVQKVEADPSRQPEEIARKLVAQLAALLDASPSLDRDRLHAEAALLATKADLREEIDRLKAHVTAARDLLAMGGPIGRKLDFLAQEFNRESNTICSKSNAVAVTSAGIELKVVIDQFREQVQNLE
ncbi:YicC family protein [Rhizobium sp. S95]|uniref:YicC family protein n=1 Tax=Ciceribacter sichuanensis TaxID=2949647 RepID=A0AAJ1F685_9HYPH|nr:MULTISPECIES: YicC/YloC family endoribonuclease [unclassified Ciceribacter]MCM2395412.1 YicC family protein [Ciceribacter sp. S95]MCO5955834.1 YicC family protein [Ciceribacter sp. S101]